MKKTAQQLAAEYVKLVRKAKSFAKREALLAEYQRKLIRIQTA